ncbi:uncharacterized protein MELLADRAFT_92691 [Melampsora larici-populina 98AG31]|uniref:DNA topoisomerase n=1 Tax=Melampsora larici-populina (strain 98AG31 / pathotype 3-4-7) TaxID=747676 RepID=F4S2H1_MELLP|nr:uncharacterized protein MELLADRAFT_92691 [Melampsora larici-populina 98AG31]EGG01207.1 hypothetical protein MELLADRAFT_92691 [Melampsora larici-populina 98AG31]
MSGARFGSRIVCGGETLDSSSNHRDNRFQIQISFTATSLLGHLTQSDFDAHHKKWSNCDPFASFDMPIERFVTPTDCDREGEHIGSEIKSVCLKANRNITVSWACFSVIIPACVSSFPFTRLHCQLK